MSRGEYIFDFSFGSSDIDQEVSNAFLTLVTNWM